VAWYAKTFGGKAGTRNNAPVVDVPGGQLRFAKADTKQAPTRGRVLDHIGFDVKDVRATAARIEAEGIKLDEPVRKGVSNTITYITDALGHPHRARRAASIAIGLRQARTPRLRVLP
jgi:hypothetical protein